MFASFNVEVVGFEAVTTQGFECAAAIVHGLAGFRVRDETDPRGTNNPAAFIFDVHDARLV